MIDDDEICFKMFSAHERLLVPRIRIYSIEEIVDYPMISLWRLCPSSNYGGVVQYL